MDRAARWLSAGALAAVLAGCAASSAAATVRGGGGAGGAQDPPNLIVITADDLGWNELGSYGNRFNRTPHLDALAAEGVRFTQAYATAPVCSPTRASLMTGLWPARVGITNFLTPHDDDYLHPDHATLPERLKERGYATGLLGKWHLMGDYRTRPGDPARHGFDEVVLSESVYIGGGSYFHPYHFAPEVEARQAGEHLLDRINVEAVEFIRRNRDRPFFLLKSHYAVHTQLAGRPDLVAEYEARPGAGRGEDAPRNNAHLAAQLELMDEGVRMIRATLDSLGIMRNTIIVFISDNGGDPRVTTSEPLRGGKSTLYEGGVRVPFIVYMPGAAGGVVSDAVVTTADIYPTLLELAGVRPDGPSDGASLAPLLHGGEPPRRDAVFWHYPLDEPHFLGGRSAGAIRSGRYKLIEFFDTDSVELYDLENDPAERRDLAQQMPERAAELRARLAAWRADVGARLPPPDPRARRPHGVQLHLRFAAGEAADSGIDHSGLERHLRYRGEPADGGGAAAGRGFGGQGQLELPRADAPHPMGKAITVHAVVRPTAGDGVILAHGGSMHGYALHLQGGHPAFSVAIDGRRTTVTAPKPLPEGWSTLTATLAADGTLTLSRNGALLAREHAGGLMVRNPADGLQIGADLESTVGSYRGPSRFVGTLREVRVEYAPGPGR